MTARSFFVGDVLSVTTGRLVGPSGIGGVYDVLDHIAGRPHMTHELPDASERWAPEIVRQVPEIAEAMPPVISCEAEAAAWCAEVAGYIGRSKVDLVPAAGVEG